MQSNTLFIKPLFQDATALLDLGMQPVSNRFLDNGEVSPQFPLQLNIDNVTGIIFIEQPFPIDEVKPRYEWLTCYEPEEHLDDLVECIAEIPGLSVDSVVAAYSFKDQSTLDRLEIKGFKDNWVISPEEDLGITDPCANVETYQSFFTREKAAEIRKARGPADIFVVRHVIEHSYDLLQFIDAVEILLKPGGYTVWELPDCENALIDGDCTTIWEEHIYYFTPSTFKNLLSLLGYEIDYFHSYPYALENSITAIVHKVENKGRLVMDELFLNKIHEQAVHFAASIEQRKLRIRNRLAKLSEGNKISIFGAGHLSVAFISILEISDLIDISIDDNEHKKGKRLSVGNIGIYGSDVLYNSDIKICLLGLNPQNQPKVVNKHREYIAQGGEFFTIFPQSIMDEVGIL
jgi:hypothetical protein